MSVAWSWVSGDRGNGEDEREAQEQAGAKTRETDGQAGTTRAPGAGSAVSFASGEVRSINFKWVFLKIKRIFILY